jgi:hypothetical protein
MISGGTEGPADIGWIGGMLRRMPGGKKGPANIVLHTERGLGVEWGVGWGVGWGDGGLAMAYICVFLQT